MMQRRTQIALALLPFTGTVLLFAQQAPPRPNAPLDDAQVRAMVQRAIAVQHRSEDALDEYDRTERVISRDGDDQSTETVSRLVPVGGGEMRVEMDRNGQPVPADEIASTWRNVMGTMESRTHVNDPDVKKEYEKAGKRKEEVSKMVDAIGEAFRFHYAGRMLRNGRSVVELDYEPNPGFKSSLRYAGVYRRIWGKVWVDESSGAVVRLEAQLRQDVPIGGGIIGKVYQGSHMELEQAEEAPGIWLPTFTSYDIEGRKFVFPASFHRKLYSSDYRHIGPPAQALALLRSEHAELINLKAGRPAQ
jgi:hypothetical protein